LGSISVTPADDRPNDGAHRSVAAPRRAGRLGNLYVPAARAVWNETLGLAVPLAFVTFVAIRGIVAHSGIGPILTRRTLVLGTGADAVAVENSIGNLGHAVRFLGFFPAKKMDTAHQVPGNRVLGGGMDLVDAVRRYRVDEIIVAVRERRGGVLPLRELLDCKLMGVRVLDLSSYYERAVGQLRLDSLHASWLIFGDGFRQGFLRTFVKRLFDIGARSPCSSSPRRDGDHGPCNRD
jgi:hypothetical protein